MASVAVCVLTSLAANALVPVLTDTDPQWDVAAGGLAAAVAFGVMWMLAGAAIGLLVMSSALAIVLSFLIPTGIVGLTSVIAGAPLLAAMSVIADDCGGMRSTLADVRGYRDARGLCDTELMRELLATPPADAIERPRDREALRAEAPAALRQAWTSSSAIRDR